MSKIEELYLESQSLMAKSLVITRDESLRVIELERLRSEDIRESFIRSSENYDEVLNNLYSKLLEDPPTVYDESTGEYVELGVVLSPTELMRRIKSINKLISGVSDTLLALLDASHTGRLFE